MLSFYRHSFIADLDIVNWFTNAFILAFIHNLFLVLLNGGSQPRIGPMNFWCGSR